MRTKRLTVNECRALGIPGFDDLVREDEGSGNWSLKDRAVPWEKIGPLLLDQWKIHRGIHEPALADAIALVVRYYARVGEQVLKFDGWVAMMRYADENAQTREPAQQVIAGATAPAMAAVKRKRPRRPRRPGTA